jgi:hypothetical protein
MEGSIIDRRGLLDGRFSTHNPVIVEWPSHIGNELMNDQS